MTVIATMPFIRYHKLVADYLMGLTEKPPRADKRWPHAAAFVEPQMDQRRGYITMTERAVQEAELFDKLYATKRARKKAMSSGATYAPPPELRETGQRNLDLALIALALLRIGDEK